MRFRFVLPVHRAELQVSRKGWNVGDLRLVSAGFKLKSKSDWKLNHSVDKYFPIETSKSDQSNHWKFLSYFKIQNVVKKKHFYNIITSKTLHLGSSDNLLAMTAPADPAPTMMKSYSLYNSLRSTGRRSGSTEYLKKKINWKITGKNLVLSERVSSKYRKFIHLRMLSVTNRDWGMKTVYRIISYGTRSIFGIILFDRYFF